MLFYCCLGKPQQLHRHILGSYLQGRKTSKLETMEGIECQKSLPIQESEEIKGVWGGNPYYLVIRAEVYSKHSKVLFCSSNNPKGKRVMKEVWFSDICQPSTDTQEAVSHQTKKKHALLSISEKPKYLSSTLSHDFIRREPSLFFTVVSNKLYIGIDEGDQKE